MGGGKWRGVSEGEAYGNNRGDRPDFNWKGKNYQEDGLEYVNTSGEGKGGLR